VGAFVGVSFLFGGRRACCGVFFFSFARSLVRSFARFTDSLPVPLGSFSVPSRPLAPLAAGFLDRITQAFERNPNLPSLLVDSEFANEVNSRQSSWRRVVSLCVATGIACPSMGASLSYFDAYRRARLPANLTQAQRDFFGSHTFERVDKPRGEAFHCKWTDAHA